MVLNPSQLLLFALLCASIHWLIARSEIARPFWSRVNGVIGKLLACPACSGFWLGGFLAGIEIVVPAHAMNVTPSAQHITRTVVGALLGTIVTPIFESLLLLGLAYSAIEPEGVAEAPAPSAGSVPTHVPPTDSALITPVDSPIRRRPR